MIDLSGRLVLAFAVLLLTLPGRGGAGGSQSGPVAARKAAGEAKYAKFTHRSHSGAVKNPYNKSQVTNLDCTYCHGTAERNKLGQDQHDLQAIGYPSHIMSGPKVVKGGKAHTACTSCHAFAGPRMERQMCTICHTDLLTDPKRMATNIRRFPNPDGPVKSDFFDYFSHRDHVDFYDQYATATPLRERFKFFDAKLAPAAAKPLDRNRFECATCHQPNNAPVTVAGADFMAGVKMSAPGHPECFVCHFDPKVVSPPKKDKPAPNNSFATNCTGCHQAVARPEAGGRPARGSEAMVLWFDRRIINTERNAAVTGQKSPLPYSHNTHFDAVGKSTPDCISCHATGKTAQTLADFYLVDRRSGEKQPPPFSCVECHNKEMQTKITGAVTLESAKCNYCHALGTIREIGAGGVQMPPESHFRKKPAPAAKPTSTK